VVANLHSVISMSHDSESPQESGKPIGRYANYFEIGHNDYDFVLDFAHFYVGNGPARFHTRIICNVSCARQLLKKLEKSILLHDSTPSTS
jgi:hypothetical protein